MVKLTAVEPLPLHGHESRQREDEDIGASRKSTGGSHRSRPSHRTVFQSAPGGGLNCDARQHGSRSVFTTPVTRLRASRRGKQQAYQRRGEHRSNATFHGQSSSVDGSDRDLRRKDMTFLYETYEKVCSTKKGLRGLTLSPVKREGRPEGRPLLRRSYQPTTAPRRMIRPWRMLPGCM